MTKCELCKKIILYLLGRCDIRNSCVDCGVLISDAFSAAEISFAAEPEAKPLLIAIKVIFSPTFVSRCDRNGIKWIKENPEDFAKEVCRKAEIC